MSDLQNNFTSPAIASFAEISTLGGLSSLRKGPLGWVLRGFGTGYGISLHLWDPENGLQSWGKGKVTSTSCPVVLTPNLSNALRRAMSGSVANIWEGCTPFLMNPLARASAIWPQNSPQLFIHRPGRRRVRGENCMHGFNVWLF